MNAEQRAALRKLAEDATPGPWLIQIDTSEDADWSRRWPNILADNYEVVGTEGLYGDYETDMANARHIAAANPQAIRELLDYIEALEKDAGRYLWCKLHPELAASIFEHLGPAYFDSEIDSAMQGETE